MGDFDISIVELYEAVLEKEKKMYGVNDNHIRGAIQVMKEVYMPNQEWQQDLSVDLANYNDAGHRCAYLHKHALCYTGMVYTLMYSVLQRSKHLRKTLAAKKSLNLCSLGGGPGADTVALLAVFSKFFGHCVFCVSIIDYCEGWKSVFSSIVGQLQSGRYGEIQSAVSPNCFFHQYIGGDLLRPFDLNVKQAVMCADFVSMVKFVSAVACAGTEEMVKEVFNSMKPGAMLLFIDNAAGGFLEVLQRGAKKCGMKSVCGPITHFSYDNPLFSIERFGYTSQSKTKVSLQIWMKPEAFHISQHINYNFLKPRSSTHQYAYEPDPDTTQLVQNQPKRNNRRGRGRGQRNQNARQIVENVDYPYDVAVETVGYPCAARNRNYRPAEPEVNQDDCCTII